MTDTTVRDKIAEIVWGNFCECGDTVDELMAALPELTAIKVKPLVWGNTKEPEYPFADTDFGRYEVDSLGVATFYHWHDRNLNFLCSEGTEQNAKAAAQAHHDALILSALVTSTGADT